MFGVERVRVVLLLSIGGDDISTKITCCMLNPGMMLYWSIGNIVSLVLSLIVRFCDVAVVGGFVECFELDEHMDITVGYLHTRQPINQTHRKRHT